MKTYRYITLILIILAGSLLIASCTPTTETAVVTATQTVKPTDTTEPTNTATAVASPTSTATPTRQPTATATPQPTATATSTPDAETIFEEKFQQAQNHFEANEWEKANELFDDLVETDPNNKEIHRIYNGLGLAYYYLGNLEQAISNFDQAIAKKPTFAEAYANRGDVWRDLGEPEKAFSDYDQAIELDPNASRYFYNRAITYKWQGEMEKAIADYDQAIELDPEFSYAYHNRANIYWDLGNKTQALADFDKALQFDPTDELGFLNRGLLHLELNDSEGAHADFTQIIDLCDPITFAVNDGATHSMSFDSNCTYAYLLRAEIEYRANNYEASLIDLQMGVADNPPLALDYFDYGISNNPNWGYPLFGHGLAQESLGKPEEALADYTQAIQVSGADPMRQNYYLARGIMYVTQDNLDAAIADWQQTLAANPNNADAYFNLGMAYQQMGDYETAVDMLTTALTNETEQDVRLDLALRLIYNAEWLLFNSDNEDQAKKAVSTYEFVINEVSAIELPAGAWNNLCWGASAHDMAADAMYACDLAVELDPSNGAVRDSRGVARALTGDFSGAIEDFQAFITWGQGSSENIELRQEWVQALENGTNPIDEAVLEIIRNDLRGSDP